MFSQYSPALFVFKQAGVAANWRKTSAPSSPLSLITAFQLVVLVRCLDSQGYTQFKGVLHTLFPQFVYFFVGKTFLKMVHSFHTLSSDLIKSSTLLSPQATRAHTHSGFALSGYKQSSAKLVSPHLHFKGVALYEVTQLRRAQHRGGRYE